MIMDQPLSWFHCSFKVKEALLQHIHGVIDTPVLHSWGKFFAPWCFIGRFECIVVKTILSWEQNQKMSAWIYPVVKSSVVPQQALQLRDRWWWTYLSGHEQRNLQLLVWEVGDFFELPVWAICHDGSKLIFFLCQLHSKEVVSRTHYSLGEVF